MTRMENSKEILTELQEIAPLLSKDGVSRIPYIIPSGYFEDFSAILMSRIRLEAAGIPDPAMAGMLTRNEPAEISPLEEISSMSPLLAGIQKKNPYQVPAGYFETLKTKIHSSAVSSSIDASENIPSKQVALHSRLSASDSDPFSTGFHHVAGKTCFHFITRDEICRRGLPGWITRNNDLQHEQPKRYGSHQRFDNSQRSGYGQFPGCRRFSLDTGVYF